MNRSKYSASIRQKRRHKAMRVFLCEWDSLIQEGYSTIKTVTLTYPWKGAVKRTELIHSNGNSIMLELELDTLANTITISKNGKKIKELTFDK